MASISDVAKLANVSRSTVSLVCNNKGYVSKETREKIEKAMKELNYVPSELGRNLKKRRSNIIGIIVPDIAHPFFGTFIKYAERTLFQRGYKTMVCGTAGREDVESTFLQMLERKTMDGVIMGAHSLKVEQYLTISRPIVTLDRYLSESIPSVHINKTQAAELAASLFCEKGRKNIVQLVSSYTVPNYEKEKDLIFRKKIESYGGTVTDIAIGYNVFTEEGYRHTAKTLFEKYPDVDGIWGTDMAAIACIQEAEHYGRHVPGDLSVIALDGTYITRLGQSYTTAIVQPIEDLAQKCVDLVIDMIEKETSQISETIFDVTIQEGTTL